MNSYVFILGRERLLSVEELIAVLEPLGQVEEVGEDFLIFNGLIAETQSLLSQLGGTIKIAEVIASHDIGHEVTLDDWMKVLRPSLTETDKRFVFGLSCYGAVRPAMLRRWYALGLELKKKLKLVVPSARLVVNSAGQLSSVATFKNKLIGREIVMIVGRKLYIAVTRAVQDFSGYSFRDYGRPARDMKRGMLPPKLAQVMLNLGRAHPDDTLLDPFCGGGTVLQEALLMGLRHVYGSDSDPSAMAEAGANIRWLRQHFNLPEPELRQLDVATLADHYQRNFFSLIVTEPYLGPPALLKSGSLTRQKLAQAVSDVKRLYQQFFRSLEPIVKPGGRLVVVFPIFQLFGTQYDIGPLAAFESFGWRLQPSKAVHFAPSKAFNDSMPLVYHREDQVVARAITVWRKISS